MLRYTSGRPAGIAFIVVGRLGPLSDTFLIRRGLLVAAIAVAITTEIPGFCRCSEQ